MTTPRKQYVGGDFGICASLITAKTRTSLSWRGTVMSDIVEVMEAAIVRASSFTSESMWPGKLARAALAALEQAGYAVAPVVPTEAMIAAPCFAWNVYPGKTIGEHRRLQIADDYVAMIKQAAADTAGPTRPSDQEDRNPNS